MGIMEMRPEQNGGRRDGTAKVSTPTGEVGAFRFNASTAPVTAEAAQDIAAAVLAEVRRHVESWNKG